MQSQIPHLVKTANTAQLHVKGKPFLMLPAELQNSSLTSAEYMKGVWPKLRDANVNTVLGCVTWEQVEPVEGQFDFSELDKVLQDAREHGLRLVLLWFGSFKNGLSTYTPPWVKKNITRFPRAKLIKGSPRIGTADVLSIFHAEAVKADANAFGKFMQHLKEVDEDYLTVLMVQVENEAGFLGDSRDGSDAANKKFAQPVPEDLADFLREQWDSLHAHLQSNLQVFKASGFPSGPSWEDTFGTSKQTDELFMAYHYALYIEQVAVAGKAAYPIPLYTNVWQSVKYEYEDDATPTIAGGGNDPGEYPSGGGVVNVLDIWQFFAPTLDFISPDIYLNNYAFTCDYYRHRDQPLFIPEQRRDEYGARRIWKAYGSYQALGASPFGIDTLDLDSNSFRQHFGLLAKVSYHVLEAQRKPGSMTGFFFDELPPGPKGAEASLRLTFGGWKLQIERSFVFGKPSAGYGMVIHKADDDFLLIGEGFQVTFTSAKHTVSFTGILSFLEKEVVDAQTGEMKTVRMLNGDETRSGKSAVMPSKSPDYGGFPISITIPAGTRIAMCTPYCVEE